MWMCRGYYVMHCFILLGHQQSSEGLLVQNVPSIELQLAQTPKMYLPADLWYNEVMPEVPVSGGMQNDFMGLVCAGGGPGTVCQGCRGLPLAQVPCHQPGRHCAHVQERPAGKIALSLSSRLVCFMSSASCRTYVTCPQEASISSHGNAALRSNTTACHWMQYVYVQLVGFSRFSS